MMVNKVENEEELEWKGFIRCCISPRLFIRSLRSSSHPVSRHMELSFAILPVTQITLTFLASLLTVKYFSLIISRRLNLAKTGVSRLEIYDGLIETRMRTCDSLKRKWEKEEEEARSKEKMSVRMKYEKKTEQMSSSNWVTYQSGSSGRKGKEWRYDNKETKFGPMVRKQMKRRGMTERNRVFLIFSSEISSWRVVERDQSNNAILPPHCNYQYFITKYIEKYSRFKLQQESIRQERESMTNRKQTGK